MKQGNSLPILCFVLISFIVASVSAQTCIENRKNFIPNDKYDKNRRLTLSSLPSNASSHDGFYRGFIVQEPNRVYAVGMCIPGSTPGDCFDCIKSASDWLIHDCPDQTDAYNWGLDPTFCLVRYANTSFTGSAAFWEITPQYLVYNTADITSNITEFTAAWGNIINRTIAEASAERSIPSSRDNYYKTGFAHWINFQIIYVLMQCTPDISPDDCNYCLRQSVTDYQSCCGQQTGGYVMRPICFFRWQFFTFSKAFGNTTVAPPLKPPVNVPQPPSAGGPARKKDSDSQGISAGIVVAITVPTVVIILILLFLRFVLGGKTKTPQRTEFESDSDISITQALQYEFKTLRAATNKFSQSNKLGEGGFGEVYKGILSNGSEVAVKRLSKVSGQDARKFRKEAVLASKLQHRNLVSLLGFCLQGEEKILIYEFVPNKSLDNFLFDPAKKGQLDWTRRYKIIRGIAQGILHLHQDPQPTIIYRDFKANNILLDTELNPKISDYGMATVFGMEEARGNTNRIAETFVYMSPEYAMHGKFSMKSDVYSFGVLVLEIISGKKNSDLYQMDVNSFAENLVTYAWRHWSNRAHLELVDPTIERNYPSNEVTRCLHIALLCVQENPEDRPMLSTIIMMLTSNTITLPAPRLPGFFPTKQAQTGPNI